MEGDSVVLCPYTKVMARGPCVSAYVMHNARMYTHREDTVSTKWQRSLEVAPRLERRRF